MISDKERFEKRYSRTEGCWFWNGYLQASPNDYGRFRARGLLWKAHRFSYQLYRGPIPEGKCVCHSCDRPSCVNPDHLFLGTHAENIADRDAKGRTDRKGKAKGFAHYKAKLTAAQIAAIRTDERVQHVVAKYYGIAQQTVSRIRAGQRWANIA